MPFIDLQGQYQRLKVDIDARIQAVLNHGQYIMGPEVYELEDKLADYTGAKYCITVASGTEALLISLMAIDLQPGDEVITTPFTFAATAESIVRAGARPVFVDIEPDTGNLNAALIEASITNRTRAIMPVSLYGQPCDMKAINSIAERHNLVVIEDAAQSFGATIDGRKSGNLSAIACTSFFPSKPLGCYGDGGAIFTSDEAIATACRQIRVHGQSERYVHSRIGVGGRMDTIQCAVVLAKLSVLDEEIAQRQHVYQCALEQSQKSLSLWRPTHLMKGRTSAFAQLTLMAPNRDEIVQSLTESGVPTALHYPKPLNQQAAYAEFCCGECCPVAQALADQCFSLPFSQAALNCLPKLTSPHHA
ncbi:MAG: DegT/DnrJ/EryC1/StrS family aminotransferase [Burkholderiaceae bacterium]